MKKTKYIFPLALFLALWAALAVFCWVKPQDSLSLSERRKLTQFPEITVNSLLNGSFSEDFEKAALDQFPMRDSFRRIKSLSVYYLLGQKDNNDIYMADGFASKLDYPLNKSSVEHAGTKITEIYETYLKGHSGNIYLSVVPDKNYFLAEENGYPHIDYEELVSIIREQTPFASYIDIFPYLELADYYKTDSHWRQEHLVSLAQALAEALGTSISGEFTTVNTNKEFYGVYYGQSALPMKSENIYYLTNEVLESCSVYDPITDSFSNIYNMVKLNSRDPYEMYLSGAASVLTIKNPSSSTGKRLIVFRDSFASSLIPLLAEGYDEITLADTRYILPSLLGDYVDFEGADVLFMYSSSLLGSSRILK